MSGGQFAGFYAVCAPEEILARPVARGSDAARTRQHAAIVAASPVFWLRLLPARGAIWETDAGWEVPDGPFPRILSARERSRPRRVRRIIGPIQSDTPRDLPDGVRAALASLAADTEMPLDTMMHLGYWAWRYEGPPRAIDDPARATSEPEHCLRWLQEGRRTLRDLPETIKAMQLRWLKEAMPKRVGSYYHELSGDRTQSEVIHRIQRVEERIPVAFLPDPRDAASQIALNAMWDRIRLGWPPGKLSR